MKAHPLLLRAGVAAALAFAWGAQAQVPRLGAGTAAGKPVNTQQAATFGLPRPGGLSSPMPNSLTAGSTAVNTAGSATTSTANGGSATIEPTTTTTPEGNMTGTTGSTDPTATAGGTVTTGGTVIGSGGVATTPAGGAYAATAVMGAGAGTNLPAPRQGASMGPGPYTPVETAGAFLGADANADGELSRAEATRLSIMPFAFEEMDANHDGVVTRSEYEESLRR